MYPSGVWAGYWEQDGFGRQEMAEFELHFRPDGLIRGHGRDIAGRFTFAGEFSTTSGQVTLTKQYLGKHKVEYVGRPDGEGCILGTWVMIFGGIEFDRGAFVLRPILRRPTGDEPISEIR